MQADEQNRRATGGAGAGPSPTSSASCPPGRPPSAADAAHAHEAGRTVSAADYVVNAGAAASAARSAAPAGGGAKSSYSAPDMAGAATGRPGAARSVWVEDTGKHPNDAGSRFDAGDAGPSPADAFKEAMAKVGEIKEYASYFVAAKVDGIKSSVRNVVVYAALGVVGLLVGGAILATAAVLLLTGLAGAINMLFYRTAHPEHWQWVGALVVSLLVLGGVVAGVLIGLKKVTGGSRKNTVKKYETRQRVQREQFGHDVHDRAAERQAHAAAEAGAVRRNGHG